MAALDCRTSTKIAYLWAALKVSHVGISSKFLRGFQYIGRGEQTCCVGSCCSCCRCTGSSWLVMCQQCLSPLC